MVATKIEKKKITDCQNKHNTHKCLKSNMDFCEDQCGVSQLLLNFFYSIRSINLEI